MVKRVPVRSRSGNFILAFVGAVYALTALVVLVWFVVDVWQVAELPDLMLQGALAASAACGIWFVNIALDNLRQRGASKPASIQR